MLKKKFSFILALIIIFSSVLTAYAYENSKHLEGASEEHVKIIVMESICGYSDIDIPKNRNKKYLEELNMSFENKINAVDLSSDESYVINKFLLIWPDYRVEKSKKKFEKLDDTFLMVHDLLMNWPSSIVPTSELQLQLQEHMIINEMLRNEVSEKSLLETNDEHQCEDESCNEHDLDGDVLPTAEMLEADEAEKRVLESQAVSSEEAHADSLSPEELKKLDDEEKRAIEEKAKKEAQNASDIPPTKESKEKDRLEKEKLEKEAKSNYSTFDGVEMTKEEIAADEKEAKDIEKQAKEMSHQTTDVKSSKEQKDAREALKARLKAEADKKVKTRKGTDKKSSVEQLEKLKKYKEELDKKALEINNEIGDKPADQKSIDKSLKEDEKLLQDALKEKQ